MATMLGGKVGHSSRREYGRGLYFDALIHLYLRGSHQTPEFGTLMETKLRNFHWIHASVSTENSSFAAVEDRDRLFFGLQFHPEVVHSDHGRNPGKLYFGICGCTRIGPCLVTSIRLSMRYARPSEIKM